MGKEAETTNEEEVKEEEVTEEEGTDESEESPEFELVREGETQAPKKAEVPVGLKQRFKKLTGQKKEAEAEAEKARKQQEELQEEIKRLKQSLDSGSEKGPPDPNNFDGGVYDPEYVKALNSYNDKVIEERISQRLQESQQKSYQEQTQHVQSQEMEKALMDHYKRATDLGAKDYAEVEDKAMEVLGEENFKHLASNIDDSEVIMYYFGKNPEVAEQYSEMLRTKPIKALAEIGRLLAQIKKKPKSEPLPDPDEELEGATPSNQEAQQRKLDKLRQAATSGESSAMKKVLDFKKKMKEKGITVR